MYRVRYSSINKSYLYTFLLPSCLKHVRFGPWRPGTKDTLTVTVRETVFLFQRWASSGGVTPEHRERETVPGWDFPPLRPSVEAALGTALID